MDYLFWGMEILDQNRCMVFVSLLLLPSTVTLESILTIWSKFAWAQQDFLVIILIFYYFIIFLFQDYYFFFFTIVPWGSMFDNEKAEPVNFPQQTCIYEQQVGQEELLSWTSGHPCRWWPMLGHPFWGSDPCPRWSLALCRMRPISHQFQIEMSSNLQQGVMHAMMQA